ncbi:MAG: hypothetical protein BGO67_12285 [Alphaproteobacteria bacterium 41-28]|nr:MAG: hypothetical protein BGO67_12285 [Alphaproteobacteria bacterium 41-28]
MGLGFLHKFHCFIVLYSSFLDCFSALALRATADRNDEWIDFLRANDRHREVLQEPKQSLSNTQIVSRETFLKGSMRLLRLLQRLAMTSGG